MTNISGKHALLKMLQKEGVNYMFGNPGTSEAPMMAIMNEYPSINEPKLLSNDGSLDIICKYPL